STANHVRMDAKNVVPANVSARNCAMRKAGLQSAVRAALRVVNQVSRVDRAEKAVLALQTAIHVQARVAADRVISPVALMMVRVAGRVTKRAVSQAENQVVAELGAAVRIVGGKFRGRALVTPSTNAIRPTTDRTRESLFNILAHNFPDNDR